MRSVCVFCGSSRGANPEIIVAARQLGALLAERDIDLIYGGGSVGLMGELADSVLAKGGRAIGVIPQFLLDKEVGHVGLTQLKVVNTMHERKALMAELSDAFVALPGGIGTFEEFFEVWTWGQLGLHAKPYALLNVANFFDPLLTFLDHVVAEKLLRSEHRQLLLVESKPAKLLDRISTARPTQLPKWIDDEQT